MIAFSKYLNESKYPLLKKSSKMFSQQFVYDDHLSYDAHTTHTFAKLSSKIVKLGLNIMQKTNGVSYSEENKRIVHAARALSETEIDPKNTQSCFL